MWIGATRQFVKKYVMCNKCLGQRCSSFCQRHDSDKTSPKRKKKKRAQRKQALGKHTQQRERYSSTVTNLKLYAMAHCMRTWWESKCKKKKGQHVNTRELVLMNQCLAFTLKSNKATCDLSFSSYSTCVTWSHDSSGKWQDDHVASWHLNWHKLVNVT